MSLTLGHGGNRPLQRVESLLPFRDFEIVHMWPRDFENVHFDARFVGGILRVLK